MTGLVEWLRAATADREQRADDIHDVSCASLPAIRSWDDTAHGMGDGDGVCDCGEPLLVLRTVQAHREILDRHGPGVSHPEECGRCNDPWVCPDVLAIVGIYRESFPGFDPSWIGES